MFIDNVRKGIIVSTADHFTKPSKDVREKLLNENRLELFELYDFNRFCTLLDLYNTSNIKPWYKILDIWNKR